MVYIISSMIDQEQTKGVSSIQVSRRSLLKALGLSSLAVIAATEGASGYNFPAPRPVAIPPKETDPRSEYSNSRIAFGEEVGSLAGAILAPIGFLYGVYRGEFAAAAVAKRWGNFSSGIYTAAGGLASYFLGRAGGGLMGRSIGKVAKLIVEQNYYSR